MTSPQPYRFMSRRTSSLLYSCLVLLIGAGAFVWLEATRPEARRSPPPKLGPVPVESRVMASGPALLSFSAYGNLEAGRRARLASEVGGVVAEVSESWLDGAEIEAGAVLLRVDTKLLALDIAAAENRIAEAEAGVEGAERETVSADREREIAVEREALARREEERARALFERGDVPQSVVDSARSAATLGTLERERADGRIAQGESALAAARSRLETARSALALLEERRSRSELRAPFSGRIVGDRPALGTWIAPGEPLCTVLDLNTLRLRVQVPEQDLPGLVAGETAATVTLPSLPGLRAAGRVTSIGAVADPETRSIPVRIEFESRDFAGPEAAAVRLVEGQFAQATLEIERLRDVLTLQRNEVSDRGGVATVFVIEPIQLEGVDGLVRATGVQLGRETAGGAGRVVLSGLLAGTRIATSRLDALQDGEPILLEPSLEEPNGEGLQDQ